MEKQFEFNFKPANETVSRTSLETPQFDLSDLLGKHRAIEEQESEEEEDDVIEIEKTKKLINKYKSSSFSSYLEALKLQNYDKVETLSIKKLKVLLEKIQYHISSKHGNNIGLEIIFTGISFIEQFVISFYDKIKGLTDNLRKDDMFKDTVEEITLEHLDISIQDKKKRLALSLTTNIQKTIANNTTNIKQSETEPAKQNNIKYNNNDLANSPKNEE